MADRETSPAPLSERRNIARRRVLIVEDNALDMALFGALLRTADFEVLEATNASQGLDLARHHCPDLIIMDVRLPDMSGFEATRILKSEHTTRNIPVVLTSAYGPFIEGKNVEACGCDGYMPTPIETTKFIELIHSFITTGARNISAGN